MKPVSSDVALFRAFQKSPLLWIEKNFDLTAQPLKPYANPDLHPSKYTEQDFEPFEKGKHVTWQQWQFFRCIELAIEGKAPRWISVRSGHGTGKSSSCALLLLWFLFCHKDAQVPCTAPTADQLKDVLWKEVKLWIGRMKPEIAVLYEWQDQYIRIVERPGTWFARARTGRKESPEALAGVHGEHILMIADEASGIAEEIYETAQGALTSENIFVVLISNPTRLSGYFFQSHHGDSHNWQTLRFNSEESPIVPDGYCQRMAEKYGKDSPQYFIRVLGEFPTSEEDQFIPTDLFDAAAERQFARDTTAPRIMGVDGARYGDDSTAISERQGGHGLLLKVRHSQDTMATVGDVVDLVKTAKREDNPFDVIAVDVIGIGAGIVDRLKELQRQGDLPASIQIIGVNVAEKPFNDGEYVNRTSELWDLCKDWLKLASVEPQFKEDLCGRKYGFDSRGRLLLEKKEDMKERGLSSPDRGDSLVLTFAVKSLDREKVQGKAKQVMAKNLRRRANLPRWAGGVASKNPAA